MKYIVRPGDSCTAEQLGGKGGALTALRLAGVPIPAFFVLSPEAFYASLNETERRALNDARNTAPVLARIGQITPGPELCRELAEALAELCPNGARVAVRSSALEEDGTRHSFAGQLDSFLFVKPAEVTERVSAVWRSAFSKRVLAYRREQRLPLTFQPPAVLIQQMVNAERSGVAFGADPVTGFRDVAVVGGLYGLGTALVSGECDADTYHVDRKGCILNRHIADKRWAHRYDPDSAKGLCNVKVPEADAGKPALTDDQICAVAELAHQTGKHFGCPQDIEWAIENGRLYLLQSRPISSLSTTADRDGVLNIWDNSNIAESYSGVTTPLTFSFARRAYEEVYRQFCQIMGVPSDVIEAHNGTFRRMIGLIQGRIYYNLLSWYRVLATLPGFTFNRRFMEQMMGVREGLPESLVAEIRTATWRTRLSDGINLFISMGRLIMTHFLLSRRIKRFNQKLDLALALMKPPLEELRAEELAAHYHTLEGQLLTRWDAPILNDFFTMVFFGVLRRLTENWCGGSEGALQNDLLCGEGEIISAEPVKRMREMAQIAGRNPDFAELLRDGSLGSILDAMEQVPDFKDRYLDYLDKFAERCIGELKLESPTLNDDPLLLLRSVGQLSRRLRSLEPTLSCSIETEVHFRAERQVQGVLKHRPVRHLFFNWILRHARARLRDRENLRFKRTQLFGRTRRIFVEIGKRLHALDLLESPRDIFYLEVDEILGFVEGTSTCTNLKSLIALRRAEFERYHESPPPDSRFETRGIVHHGNPFRQVSAAEEVSKDGDRKGIGCSPGMVRGPVRVITDPGNASLRIGEILVAERTDPGWVVLFPSAAGLLVERGSLLSHSAIVAREIGIPTVVSIDGLTRWLKDGDWVEFNGRSGVVRRIEPSEEEANHAA